MKRTWNRAARNRRGDLQPAKQSGRFAQKGIKLARPRPGVRAAVLVLAIALAGALVPLLAARRAGAQPVGGQSDTAPSGTSSAGNGELDLYVRAGLGKLEINNWSGAWVPFRVTVSNQGPAVVGNLVVRTESNNGAPSQAREFVKEVQLPTGAHQLHEIPAFLTAGDNPRIRVQLVSGDHVLVETPVQVSHNWGGNDQLELLVVDADSTTLNNISAAQIQQQPSREPFKLAARTTPQRAAPNITIGSAGGPPVNRGPRGFAPILQSFTAHPSVIAPEDLPRDFVSYDLTDVVVINEAPLSQLTEDQARAVRLWVASGGLLVVTGAADLAGMRATRLDELLPIEPAGAAAAGGIQAAELTQVYGAFENPESTPGLSGRLKPGARAMLGPAERAIVAERDYGNGLVRFVAINPKLNPYRAWNGSKELWSDLIWPAAASKPRHTNWITMGARGPGRSGRFGIQDFLFHLAEVQPPSARYVIFFLLAYVLLVGPINYTILKWRRKTDLAWLTIPAVVVVFTLVSVTVAQMSHGGKSVIADASLVQVYQRDGITSQTSGLIVVPSARDVQELSFPGAGAYATDVFSGGPSGSASSNGAIQGRRAGGQYLLTAPLTARLGSLFQYRAVREGEPALLSARPSAGGVTLKNLGDGKITKAVYLSPEGVSDLIDLDAGSQQTLVLQSPPGQSFNVWYAGQLGEGDETELFDDLASVLDREVGGDQAISNGFFETQVMSDAVKRLGRPLVFAFIEKAPGEIGFKSNFKRSSRALYVIHL